MIDPKGPVLDERESSQTTILIVDDQTENLEVLSKILKPSYRVRAARSGEQTLQAAGIEPRPDLILLDVMMPGMDGFTVLERLHENPATRDIPVIFVTARGAAEDEQYGLERGAVDYITKPIRPMVVLARVKVQLEIKQARDRLNIQKNRLEAEVARRVEENLQIIQEKNRIELQLFQAQKLEAIGTLAGGIAHDFNNILSAIIGYTEMAEFYAAEGKPLGDNLQHVLRAAHRAKDLVKHILTFSRQADAKEFRPVSLALIIKEVTKLLRATLPATVEIRLDMFAEGGVTNGDPTQLHQILMNLCTNAAHAMRQKGGMLEVGLTTLQLDPQTAKNYEGLSAGAYIKLTVKDTGHGMDAATLERIFDPYFTTKGVGEGTGLGLAVVHGIVKSHGGAIAVQSKPGEGTLFEVLFPRIEAVGKKTDEPQGPVPRGSERILLVDDEKPLAELGKRMLLQLGYQVTAMTSSTDALELLRADPSAFDLVVTDYTMPRMTGADLARELRQVRRDLRIILCSGYNEMIDEEKAAEMGFSAFIMKPIDRRNFAQVIRRVLDEE